MQNEVRVGDVVVWEDVPSNALVREDDAACAGCFTVRRADRGLMVWAPGAQSWRSIVANDLDDDGWPWERGNSTTATIIALGLTGQESATDLQRLVETFEVQKALDAALECPQCGGTEAHFATVDEKTCSQPWCTECDVEMGEPAWISDADAEDEARPIAERLHAAGWRPGMTAEDAARLLAEAGR